MCWARHIEQVLQMLKIQPANLSPFSKVPFCLVAQHLVLVFWVSCIFNHVLWTSVAFSSSVSSSRNVQTLWAPGKEAAAELAPLFLSAPHSVVDPASWWALGLLSLFHPYQFFYIAPRDSNPCIASILAVSYLKLNSPQKEHCSCRNQRETNSMPLKCIYWSFCILQIFI